MRRALLYATAAIPGRAARACARLAHLFFTRAHAGLAHPADALGDPELEDDMRAAAFVSHGGQLSKWRKAGREKPHRRFVRVASGASSTSGRRMQVVLHWDKKSEEVVRADEEVYDKCFQGEAPNSPGAFQVILTKRMLFLVAETAEEVRPRALATRARGTRVLSAPRALARPA